MVGAGGGADRLSLRVCKTLLTRALSRPEAEWKAYTDRGRTDMQRMG